MHTVKLAQEPPSSTDRDALLALATANARKKIHVLLVWLGTPMTLFFKIVCSAPRLLMLLMLGVVSVVTRLRDRVLYVRHVLLGTIFSSKEGSV